MNKIYMADFSKPLLATVHCNELFWQCSETVFCQYIIKLRGINFCRNLGDREVR